MPLTDQELIRRARKGDKAAFGQLWERHEKQVYQHCCRWLDSPRRDPAIEASDLLTETFIRALHGLDRYEDRTAEGKRFSAWLLEIAKRLCLKALTRQQRRLPPHAVYRSVEETAEEHLLLRLAAQEINSLPETYQVPLKLTLEEYSHKEIAEHLGISVAAAMQRLSRARKRLHSRLAEQVVPESPLPARYLEARLSEIVRDVRIVTISLSHGGELQLCVGVPRKLARGPAGEREQRWLERADLLYYQGQWAQARAAYSEVLERESGCARAAVALARMLRREQRGSEAATVLTAALERVAPETRSLLEAERFVALGDDVGALPGYRAALAADPLDGETHYQLSRALGRLSRYEEQLAALENQRRCLPEDPGGYIESYVPCARLGRWELAHTLLERAVELDPNHPLALKHLFQVRMNLGLHDEETLTLAERLVRIAPEFAESWAELAWIYAELGRHEESVGVLKAFLRDHPGSGEAHAALAWRYHYQGNLRQRRRHALRAYALLPESSYVCWTRILAATLADRAVLDEIAVRFSTDAFLHLQLSRACQFHQRLGAAESFARRAVALVPEEPDGLAQLAQVLLLRRKWHDIVVLLQGSPVPHLRYRLAVALKELQAPEAASVRATLSPQSPFELLALAEAAASSRRFADASAFLCQLEQSPLDGALEGYRQGLKKRFPELSDFPHTSD